MGKGVAAVGEGVKYDLGDTLLDRQLDARLEVLPARVHAAVGDEAEQVDAAAGTGAGPLAGCPQGLVLEEAAVGDRVVDPGQVLVDDSAGAEVEVAYLRVPHLPRGQADVTTLGGELRVRAFRPEPVEVRGLSLGDRVPRTRAAPGPSRRG